ncbi:ABC transporter ATP-binding protein [Arthrobacter castelli]|uniref:ABC transporter ATP-binding protein n=1 Tax=Arthrobacter castelli TaxID=271431 RepID=UPI000411E7C2|nr:ABC transporter ATP-binding protein [Arthrobacter castelli]
MTTTIAAPLAAARNVSKTFGTQKALDGVSLDIQPGEAVGLLGPNGAGKSTLIGLLTGLRRSDGGTVELFGHNPLTPAARRALGVTPQATAVPHTLKVREAVELVAAHFTNAVPVAELLDQFGLTDMASKQCGGLSGGQQRRLLVAIALVGRPSLVILDEPTTGLDVEAREILWEQLRQYRANGGTMLITSHYLAEIEALASRVVVIDQGHVVADGTVDEIRGHISVRRISLRTPTALDTLAALPGVVDAANDGGTTRLVSRDADELVRRIVGDGIDFSDLQVHAASLEEAFMAITGTGSAPSSPKSKDS